MGHQLPVGRAHVRNATHDLVVRQAVSEGVIGTRKNGRTREVPLGKQAFDALRGRPRNGPYVFCAPAGFILTHAQTSWGLCPPNPPAR